MSEPERHWAEAIANQIVKYWGDELREPVVINGGLSVSGLQHVGRLRGEIILGDAVRRILEEEYGLKVKQYLTLYTQDEWKGKPSQLKAYPNLEEAKKYIGWPLAALPDPKGCHSSWIEHFWEPFGSVLNEFAKEVNVITTTEMYKTILKPFVIEALKKREKVINILNEFRAKKLPEDFIPYYARCENCGKIKARVTHFDLNTEKIEYHCDFCGYSGTTTLENGKLPWRVEWAAVWGALNVSFEPFGKDHATPGGSRDAAKKIATEIYGIKPPLGQPYEWVSLILSRPIEVVEGGKKRKKNRIVMHSSDFIGFTPRDWLEVAEPEVLRYLYLRVTPMRAVALGLHLVPQYTEEFDRFESKIFSGEARRDEKRLYSLCWVRKAPESKPFRIPYLHAVILVQAILEEDVDSLLREALSRLRACKMLTKSLSDFELRLARSRLVRARNWVKKYAPSRLRFEIVSDEKLKELEDKIRSILMNFKEYYKELVENISKCEWNPDAIKEAMVKVTSKLGKSVSEFFAGLYMLFLGKPEGPRFAPLIASLSREFVLSRFKRGLELLGM